MNITYIHQVPLIFKRHLGINKKRSKKIMLINYKRKEKTKELDEYKCTVSKKTLRYGKESRRLAKNYKVLKYAFFNSPRRYDKIHGCIK